MEPRSAGGQEEGYMFWSDHFTNRAPNFELGAQIARNPFRLTASISPDFSIDVWVRIYCTDPPINGARSHRQRPSLRPAGALLRPTEDLFRPSGPSSDRHGSTLRPKRALQRPIEALLRSTEALPLPTNAFPENDRGPSSDRYRPFSGHFVHIISYCSYLYHI